MFFIKSSRLSKLLIIVIVLSSIVISTAETDITYKNNQNIDNKDNSKYVEQLKIEADKLVESIKNNNVDQSYYDKLSRDINTRSSKLIISEPELDNDLNIITPYEIYDPHSCHTGNYHKHCSDGKPQSYDGKCGCKLIIKYCCCGRAVGGSRIFCDKCK